jgi:peroxiredoxin
MPFYARLVRVTDEAGVEVVSVTSDDKVAHQHYLDEYHLHVDRIIRLSDTPLRVSATPTLIVLDQAKTVLGAWVGELTSEDEDKVLHLVRSGSL